MTALTNLKLDPHPHIKKPKGPVVLVILDGVGIGKKDESDAVFLAKTPVFDSLMSGPLVTQLKAHGTAVGMPSDADMGNSEVGHNALGAGRTFDQGASLVKNAIETQSLFNGSTWRSLIDNTKKNNSTLHFIGLLSDGNVHSHIEHLIAMLNESRNTEVLKVRIHILLDGRDVDQKSALKYIQTLETKLSNINASHNYDYAIASGGGRMVTTMDRYNADWTIVERGWNAHVLGNAREFQSAKEAVETFYAEDPERTDQYLPPFVITKNAAPIGQIIDHDSVIMFNFRGDRAIELTRAFEDDTFDKFDRKKRPNICFAGMMQYDGDLHLPKNFLVDPPIIANTVSDYLCANAIRSFAISETQKYGHVTYFWNGNKSSYIDDTLETYIEIPSDKIPFDQKPDMKAVEITDKSIELIKSGKFDFGRINYPNGDMVGHTGVMDAVIQSLETTDTCLGKLLQAISDVNGTAIVLADHGNADEMFTVKDGIKTPKTSHTLNPVPCVIYDPSNQVNRKINTAVENPGLANIAATICNLLGFIAPEKYEKSIIRPQSN